MDTRDRNLQPQSSSSKSMTCLKITAILVLIASMYIAQSPLFHLRKPLKANFIKLPPIVPFEGVLQANNLLSDAGYIGHGKLRGPECLAIHKDGSMYTGLVSGWIVRVDTKTNTIHKVVLIGDEKDQAICDDFSPHTPSHQSCGAPLGVRFHPNNPDMLYATDVYYGLVKIDVKLGTKKIILGVNDTRFNDLPMKFPDDLDIDGDIIYFIDSSYEHGFNEAMDEHIEALPRGRLFSYNEKTDDLEMIADNLYFPNGLQLMPNKREILINENTMSRIIKVHLTGEKKGTKEVFAELPGFGDTIRLSDHNTLFVPFALARNPANPSLLDSMGEYPLVRSLLPAVLDFHELVIKFGPKYGLAAEYDLNGKVLKSWHDPGGARVDLITSMVVHDGKLYLGSFVNDFIAVIEY